VCFVLFFSLSRLLFSQRHISQLRHREMASDENPAFTLARGGAGRPGGRRIKRPPPPPPPPVVQTYRPLVAVTLRALASRRLFFFYHIKRMLTVGVSRDETSVSANERKVRQYEQACRWSVPSVQSVENHSSSRSPFFRLFVFVSCAPGSAATRPHAPSS